MESRRLSIIIPCYNESATVRELLRRVFVAPFPVGWEREIIVIDDGSTDGKRDILGEFEGLCIVVYHDRNQGKGTAVQTGLRRASGSHVLIQDADLEYDPSDIEVLLTVIDTDEGDVVYGSRNLRPRERAGAYVPRFGVWFLTKLINVLHRQKLTDVWTCYKLFPREAVNLFPLGRFESELLFTAALARAGYRFVEVPISYHPRDVGEGKKIRYRDGIHAIIVLVADRL